MLRYELRYFSSRLLTKSEPLDLDPFIRFESTRLIKLKFVINNQNIDVHR